MPVQEQEIRPAKKPSSLKGVEGWLFIFCLKLTVFAAAYGIYYAHESHDATVAALMVAFASLEVYTGILLWSVSPKALKTLRLYFLANFAVAVILIVLGFLAGVDDKGGENLVLAAIKTLLSAAIWMLYFIRSRRVKETYGQNFSFRAGALVEPPAPLASQKEAAG